MALTAILHGIKFSVFAWEDDNGCQVLEFLEELDGNSNSDAARIRYLISRSAVHGPPTSPYHGRLLEDGIYEFKAENGARVLWFYEEDKIIICSHGFVKKKQKTPRNEIKQAKKIRQKLTRAEIEQAKKIRRKYLEGKDNE